MLDDIEDMEAIEAEARAMDAATTGAGSAAVPGLATGSRSEAAEAQRGYAARSAAMKSLMAMPTKLNEKPGCELANFAPVHVGPKGELQLETRWGRVSLTSMQPGSGIMRGFQDRCGSAPDEEGIPCGISS